MIRRSLIIIGIILLIVTIIPALIYILNFKEHVISQVSSDWGTFGDFIGGIANPIIGIVNVLVLVYLTLKISEIDCNNRNIERENRLNESLDEIRLMGFKELNTLFLKMVRILAANTPMDLGESVGLKFELHAIIHPYIDLFETFNDLDRINNLGNKLFEIQEIRQNPELRLAIMEDFSSLLCELRAEIRKITTT